MISEGDVYGGGRQKSHARARTGEKLAAFTELKIGDYVVHENHGIGQYMGTIRLSSEGTYRDFLHIRYQGNDKLYVPTDQLDRVQKYIGSEGERPKLNRLSGGGMAEAEGQGEDLHPGDGGGTDQALRRTGRPCPGHAFSAGHPLAAGI